MFGPLSYCCFTRFVQYGSLTAICSRFTNIILQFFHYRGQLSDIEHTRYGGNNLHE